MPGRIVLYGATGYTGRLTAQAMLARGARPVLAGRDAGRLSALSARLSRAGGGVALETAVAGAEGPAALRELIGTGDVLVSTAGPFLKVGRAAVAAAMDAGAVYLDSSGEPPFIRAVFEQHGPRAERTGAVLLTAFGYDYVLGNLAGALALSAAGPAVTRVDVGYFVRGDLRRAASAGTRASAAGVLLEPGYTFRDGRIASERAAARVRSFEVDGKIREAFSIGSSEHFALPKLQRVTGAADGGDAASGLRDVGVYLGWFGGATRIVHYGSAFAALLGRLPGVRQAIDIQARRIQRSRAEPDPAERIQSDVVAVAADSRGRELAVVHLTGGDPYSFTAGILAWAACQAAGQFPRPAGALGPVEAFGTDALQAACADAGISRRQVGSMEISQPKSDN
ncbi:MAG TPA: saccharopine dehydrogenase NADP-binding domain-containing protein [Streptosporangiaceae bacterium]|nr:saccharopine dehydrogenase NADP-binding domain-containing protein [Streptosporangiaceae bacterium]